MRRFLNVVFLIMLFLPLNLKAVSKNEVDYEIYDYITEANIDIAGNLKVKEIIGVKGTFNGYIRDLVYKNPKLNSFNGELESFYGSSIYNAEKIEVLKVGNITWDGELNYDAFLENVNDFSLCSNKVMCYQESTLENGISIKMFNETEDGVTYFYIEYLLANVVVVHEDVSEVYYNFLGDEFDEDIEKYQMRLLLPSKTSEQIRVWAHGPLNGEVYFLSDDNDFYGGVITIEYLKSNTPVDMRMTFPTNLISVDHPSLKKSGVLGLDKILEVEEKRADDANRLRIISKRKVFFLYLFTGIYFVLTLGFVTFIYFKYDKERKARFLGEYNRDFIDDYDVTVVEYLFKRKVTERGFSTSILNMIYKKNIKFEEIDKKNYKFIKVNEDGLIDSEKLIMRVIFDGAGDGETVTLKDITSFAKKINGTTSPFLNSYNSWKNKVIEESLKEKFYEENNLIKILASMYSVIGFIIFIFYLGYEIINVLPFALLIFNIIFLIYVLLFTKKTSKGVEHYARWKAFKRFLLDFGRFDEKELPEIELWERYLVYASIFGIADKVSETMKIKFNSSNYNVSNRRILFDYMLWSSLNRNLNGTISSSVSTANNKVMEASSSKMSSGGGFGGGFSSGGGFGGGGGGGRGF